MRTVNTMCELNENMILFNKYLLNRVEPCYSFTLKLLKNGTCFIAKKFNGQICFFPSRFIGYARNTYEQHLTNYEKDGRVTNVEIANILPVKLLPNASLEKEYRLYCDKLGFTANDRGAFGVERKYWDLT